MKSQKRVLMLSGMFEVNAEMMCFLKRLLIYSRTFEYFNIC